MLRSLPLLLLLPAVTFGQTPEIVTKVEAKLDAERTAQRNEDVEILRRLLNKACGLPDKASVHTELTAKPGGQGFGDPERGQLVGDAKLRTTVASPVGPFDGIYLPGAGVVFTLHVPAGTPRTFHGDRIGLNSSCSACHQSLVHASHIASSVSTCTSCHSEMPKLPALQSEWDRTKMDVRGEKPKEPIAKPKDDKPSPAMCEPGNLHNLISGVLATNARNVRHLGEKESISVVVTFDDVTPTAGKVFKVSQYYEPVEKIEDGKSATKYELRTKEEWVDATAEMPPTLESKPFSADEVKKLSLGDLHLKQGKYKEACDAYGEALSRFWQKPFKVTVPKLTSEQRTQYAEELQKGVREAMGRYAKALVLADQPERAREALEMATGFVAVEVTPTTVPAKSTAPAKMILTMSKADLDAAKGAAGIKKAVKTERVNFPAEGKK